MKYTYSGKDMHEASHARTPTVPKDGVRVVQKKRANVSLIVLLIVVACAAGGVWWLLASNHDSENRNLLGERKAGGGGLSEVDSPQKVSDKDLVLYLESTSGEARQLFEYVRQSALVQENRQYAALMKDVGFVFDATNDEVNAVASRYVGENGEETRQITCYAGEMRFAKTIALAAAAELKGHRGTVKVMMEQMSPQLCFELTLDDAARLLRHCKLDHYLYDESVLSEAKSIAAGGIVGVLAHEVGHQVLGHNYQTGKDRLNNEVRRNWEKQSDLFAASVMSSTPFGAHVFAGRVFALWVRMRQTDPIMKKRPERTLDHPIDEERFVSLVMANKEKAIALGIAIPELK